jgi:2,5-diketo-D-gluconate reductase B
MNTLKVGSGEMPVLGLGTWQLQGDRCGQAVETALEIGYRHIDTAEMYENEEAIGAALARSRIPRSELYLVSKVMPQHFRAAAVRKSLDRSLEALGTDYLDLYLMHWPSGSVPLDETLEALSELRDEGSIREFGVSNFSVDLMREAVEQIGAQVVCNQVEFHIKDVPIDVLRYCRSREIAVVAYSPLDRGGARNHPILKRIAARHGKTAAQTALRWLIDQTGVAAIPKATREPHLRENFEIFDFELADEDRKAIDEAAGIV